MPTVKVGQTWEIQDSYNRMVRIHSLTPTHAVVENIKSGRKTRILLTAFEKHVLISEAPNA